MRKYNWQTPPKYPKKIKETVPIACNKLCAENYKWALTIQEKDFSVCVQNLVEMWLAVKVKRFISESKHTALDTNEKETFRDLLDRVLAIKDEVYSYTSICALSFSSHDS